MIKILKAKIIFVDWKFKTKWNNKVINMLKDACKETPLYLQL